MDSSSTVPPTSESLMVVANLFLVPPIAYILPGAKIKVGYIGQERRLREGFVKMA